MLQREFDDSIGRKLVGGELISREETTRLINALAEKKDVILHGTSGFGKSCILYELTNYLRDKNVPYLPIRLDRRDPRNTATQFGKDMGLPDSPVFSLAGLAGDRPCVLILDQLDAIRWTSSHSANALDVCKQLLGQVRSLRTGGKVITAILSCRSFDLENDPQIRHWLSDSPDHTFQRVKADALPIATLEKVIGPSINQMKSAKNRFFHAPKI